MVIGQRYGQDTPPPLQICTLFGYNWSKSTLEDQNFKPFNRGVFGTRTYQDEYTYTLEMHKIWNFEYDDDQNITPIASVLIPRILMIVANALNIAVLILLQVCLSWVSCFASNLAVKLRIYITATIIFIVSFCLSIAGVSVYLNLIFSKVDLGDGSIIKSDRGEVPSTDVFLLFGSFFLQFTSIVFMCLSIVGSKIEESTNINNLRFALI